MNGRKRNGFSKFVGLLALAWLADARGQLPNVGLPQVPLPQIRTEPLLRELGGTLGDLPTRALRIEQLAGRHRPELDRDNRGDLIVRAEVVGIDITDEALRNALAKNFQVARTRELAELGIQVTILRTPEGMSARRGLKVLRKLDPAGTYDYNHVYLDAGLADAGPGDSNSPAVKESFAVDAAPAGSARPGSA